ncbi:VOC family protein [Phaeovulum sp.]|uniref:VOC family protein n=1 Tax=Phaeovulum sp. TaxID=2934796 RepID=UPI0027322976|nr:VOC family protein [Phaeovulum sp.]MDP1670358.1 VOC family protein [Phaeovulum sp.]MDP2062785.1 VOC family protein [Phaeovulum sp.]MDP3861717.1 VOC family protein [Phaeovulum sp.]MDZ4120687.1 VOC family protein [Phaeovulum sp.]
MTAASVATSLWFESGAEEAARYYCALFSDARIDDIFPQQGDPEGRAFLVEFTLQGQRFQAMNGGPHYRLTPACSISVQLDTQAEIDRIWAALLAGGGSESRCGWLTDRWGLSWQILPRALLRLLRGPNASPVTQAMMGMVKLDIAALQAAARS